MSLLTRRIRVFKKLHCTWAFVRSMVKDCIWGVTRTLVIESMNGGILLALWNCDWSLTGVFVFGFVMTVVWVWGQAQRGVWWECRGGEELLCVGEWVQGRVAMGSPVAVQGHRQGGLFQVRNQQCPLLWWDWLGYNWVQLGCQICWSPDSRSQG